MRLVTPEQMKMLEEMSDKNRFSYEQLMENAGIGLAKEIKEIYDNNITDKKEIIFLCGNGNNGGDCFVAARYLKRYQYEIVIALLCGMPKTDIALKAFERIKDKNVMILDDINEIENIVRHSSAVIDGVFGTGFHGEIDEKIKYVFSASESKLKIAVDVPSGGNCATGQISDGTFEADYTITFAYRKFGMEQYPLKEYCGNIVIKDIGISDVYYDSIENKIELIDEKLVTGIIKRRKLDSHKGDFGKLLCVTGSRMMAGAGIMSGMSALRCGVGITTITVCNETANSVLCHIPEAMILPMSTDKNGFYRAENTEKIIEVASKATSVLIGCGLGVTDETKKIVVELLKSIRCPVILDADGINCISDCIDIIKDNKSGIILTPHPAEFSRISGLSINEIQSDRLSASSDFVKKYNCILLLKGAGTIVADRDHVYVNSTGNPGMSKGGSGDILSGMISSFVAQGISLEKAAVLSAYMHGKAGDIAAFKFTQQGMLPTDMINELPCLFRI